MDSSGCIRVQNTFHQWRALPTVVQEGQPTELMKGAIQSLISKGAISVVNPCPQQFISTLFLVEKGQGTGEFHPVINLKALNRFLAMEKFKMEGLHTARSLLRKGYHMMKLDLKDAYYVVPIHPESRKYLRFQFKGTTYEFHCLLFDLSLAPRLFTRILRPIVAKLRSEGIRTVIYLDDLLQIHHQKHTLSEIFLYARRLLSSLGFIVKLEKCSPEPIRRLVFLGAVLDTTYMSVALPEEQINRVQGACQEMLESLVNIPGWTVEPLGPHEPCRTYGPVDSTIILQIPGAPTGSAASMVRMETKVSDVIVSTLPGGPEMVGVLNSARSQQSGHHSSSVRPYYRDRCILTGLARNLQWHVDGGTLERGGGGTTHQLFGTQGSHSRFEGIPESRHAASTPESGPPSPTLYPSGNGQYNRRRLCEQEGRHLVTFSVPTSLGTVVLPADPRCMGDSPSLTGSVECGSRRSFEGIQHAHRVDASAGCLSGHSGSLLCSGDRPICLALELSAASLCVTTSRPQCFSSGCLSTGLEPVEEFHPPTSGAIASNSSESEKRQSNRPTSSPRLARSTMVRSDSTDADRYTVPTSQGEVTAVSAFQPRGISPSVAFSQSDCMADIGSDYQAAGFPEEVTNVLLASWSQSTKKRYQGPWRAWSNWCSSRGLCPFSASVTDVLTFLTETCDKSVTRI